MTKPTINTLKNTSYTKRYADGHHVYLKTHLGKSHLVPPAPSEHARRRLKGLVGPIPKTHKAKRLDNLFKRLAREGWLE